MIILGIDPGRVNVGWSLWNGTSFFTGVKKLRGTLPERMMLLYDWLHKVCSRVDIITVELLRGGQSYLVHDTACISAITSLVAEQFQKGYCEILPVTHYYVVSGKGRPSDEYNKIIMSNLGYDPPTQHERTSTGCVITVREYLKGTLSPQIKKGITWHRMI